MRKLVKNNVSWVGYLDWELEQFHGDEYSILNGSSQNAYLIEEEKTVLVDTVWYPHRDEFIENLKAELGDLKKIDCIVMNHGEQDHSGSLAALMKEIPDTPIYCTAAAVKSIEGQYGKQGWDFHTVKTGDTLEIGNGKQLIFVEMKMLHWPDSMATYLTGDNILFSMDAFGQHFAVEELFNDKADQALLYKEAMKYFANILNPFAPFVTRKLAELGKLDLPIDIIAPSHGVIWRDNPGQIVEKYARWADAYQEDQITVAYDTMWEGTAKLAHAIADEIHKQSPDTVVKVFNIAKTDKNELMTEVFKSKAIAVGSPTCVNDILTSVAGWLSFLKTLKFKGKRAAAFGCYGWSGESVKIIQEELTEAGFDVVDAKVRSNWNPDEKDFALIPGLVKELIVENAPIPAEQETAKTTSAPAEQAGSAVMECDVCGWEYDPAKGVPDANIAPSTKWEDLPDDFECPVCGATKDKFKPKGEKELDPKVMQSFSYGLFVLTAKDGDKDNGCIINTGIQAASDPLRIAISVNKANLTHDMILKTGVFNLSILSKSAQFATFQRFGFQSGRTADKMAGITFQRADNGVAYILDGANAFVSGKVVQTIDLGSHTMFIADVTDGGMLSQEAAATYAYYFAHIKPKPVPQQEARKGWVCTICGYIYEGEELPADYVCPICKHPASDFEKL